MLAWIAAIRARMTQRERPLELSSAFAFIITAGARVIRLLARMIHGTRKIDDILSNAA
jgi:hypothetical protein